MLLKRGCISLRPLCSRLAIRLGFISKWSSSFRTRRLARNEGRITRRQFRYAGDTKESISIRGPREEDHFYTKTKRGTNGRKRLQLDATSSDAAWARLLEVVRNNKSIQVLTMKGSAWWQQAASGGVRKFTTTVGQGAALRLDRNPALGR